MTFQCADVNKILACAGSICDGENVIVIRNNGGTIIPEKDVEVSVRKGSPTTHVKRHGNTYGMDAWVKNPQVQSPAESGFSGQGVGA